MLLGQLLQSRIVEALTAQDRTVRLDDDAFLLAVLDNGLLLIEGVCLNLVHLQGDREVVSVKSFRASAIESQKSRVSPPESRGRLP